MASDGGITLFALLLLLRDDLRVGVGVVFITYGCSSASSSMVALDGVFLLVVHSGEPHRSNKLAGVALTEATRDVVVVGWWRCVVVGWRRCLQTLLIGMNVKNYDELRGRVVEGVVQRGKEHVADGDVAEF